MANAELIAGGVCLGYAILSVLFMIFQTKFKTRTYTYTAGRSYKIFIYLMIAAFAIAGITLLALGSTKTSSESESSNFVVVSMRIDVVNSEESLNFLASNVQLIVANNFELDDSGQVQITVEAATVSGLRKRGSSGSSGFFQIELSTDYSLEKIQGILENSELWDCNLITFSTNCTFTNTTSQIDYSPVRKDWPAPTEKHAFRPVPPKNISSGFSHTCIIQRKLVACRGSNSYGQLGRGTFSTSEPEFKTVTGLTNVKGIVTGLFHTCALTLNGNVYCWGLNDFGQLGIGSTQNQNLPKQVDINRINELAAAGNHTCAVQKLFRVFCWGNNGQGQLGLNTTANSMVPANVKYSPSVDGLNYGGVPDFFRHVETGFDFTCFVSSIKKSSVTCFGNNSNNQLGINVADLFLLNNASYSGLSYPTSIRTDDINPLQAWKLAAGVAHVCALEFDDDTNTTLLYTWGDNSKGQLGIGNTSTNRIINMILNDTITSVAAGGYHSCVLFKNQTMACWGDNSKGQVTGEVTSAFSTLTYLDYIHVAAIAGGMYSTCVVFNDGSNACWGEG